ncbi:hypothetical protein [Chitinophaga sp. CF418]|uniref:hypothetical protein n=1 Tax=Chitinophaga sp. CF418 TaxID=1855287 RepID=UPI000915504C|nr:hypothetical protein [Chitinophaga sp. CF418]SHM44107.1 hypothetical protein SAMN05216311_102189 [Chitinophaga sp. CF418]
MMYRSLFFVGALSIFSMYACRKEKSLEGIITDFHCGYAPYSTGSSFTYQYTNSSGDTSQYSLLVSGDTTINGYRYSILNDGYSDQFIRCDNGSYFLYEQALSLPDYQLEAGDRLFLHDSYSEGATWSDTINVTISGVEQTGLLQYHMLAQQTTHTVLGKEYKNVIVVRQDAAVLVGETLYPAGTIATYYYALGIGYIETVSPTDTIRLMNYTIR